MSGNPDTSDKQGIRIVIDEDAGFCSGVRKSVEAAERLLKEGRKVCSLGHIVHNDLELERLEKLGMRIIGTEDLDALEAGTVVLLRAHGEPPSTYQRLEAAGIPYIDTTCPIVVKLQDEIGKLRPEDPEHASVIVYGDPEHPEVISLKGHAAGEVGVATEASAIPPESLAAEVYVCSQTTKSRHDYMRFAEELRVKLAIGGWNGNLRIRESACRQVANRVESLCGFARRNDVVIFLAGHESSNGKTLFHVVSDVNSRSYMVSSPEEIRAEWLSDASSIGISGATSTPASQLLDAKTRVKALVGA